MSRKLEEISAVFRSERKRWDTTVLLDCDEIGGDDMFAPSLTIKTTADEGELQNGLSYRFYGNWTSHPKYGKQFAAKTFVRCQPHGQAGTIRYLLDAPNIGQAYAIKLWKAFQGDAVWILRETPDVAAAAIGGQFTEAKAIEASAWLVEQKKTESVQVDLLELLGGRRFPKSIQRWLLSKYGNKACEVIRDDAYVLQEFPGVGWKKSDQLFLDLGGNPRSEKRQAYATQYVVRSNNNGSTWISAPALENAFAEYVGYRGDMPTAVSTSRKAGQLAVKRDSSGQIWIADAKSAENEQSIASRAVDMLTTGSVEWPSIELIDVDAHQKEQLLKAVQSRLSIFAGCPGSGKTFTIARLIKSIGESFGYGEIAVFAPSNQAAQRMTQVLREYGVPIIRATTIHSLLGVACRDGGSWEFQYNESNPLPCKFFFLDEASMPDTDTESALFRALPADAHLMEIGDTNQLPPVDHGAPFRDLIAAGVPMGELTKIRRNAGSIVEACKAIREGRMFSVDETLNPSCGKNLKHIDAANGDIGMDAIVKTMNRLHGLGIDPVWDCQVIVAVNKKSPLSRVSVNERLQREFNPDGQAIKGIPFRAGDKIVCLKKSMNIIADSTDPEVNREERDGKVLVVKGEIGRIVQVENKIAFATFDAPKRAIKIFVGSSDDQEQTDDGDDNGSDEDSSGSKFDLAYGVTGHKMQGSERKVTFTVLDDHRDAFRVCSNEWLYTCMSRPQIAGFTVGKLHLAESMIRRRALSKRKTFLAELIREQLATASATN